MNTARLWLGRQWESAQFAQRLERPPGSAPDAGRRDGVDRTMPGDGRDARSACGEDVPAPVRKPGSGR